MKGTPRDRVHVEATRLLEAGVAGGVFPGGVACISWSEGDDVTVVDAAGGRFAPGESFVQCDTPYDLASLTKPFVAMTALRLVDRGVLQLETPVEAVVSDLRGGGGRRATLGQLLGHSSGLAAWGGLYLDLPHEPGSNAARRWILAEAARRVEAPPGSTTVYSDLGYMLAGEMVARAVGMTLDEVVRREVLEPLGLSADVVFARQVPEEQRVMWAQTVPPTERCPWRGRLIRGEVHDENCSAMGGVSGHAGLFGPARAVAAFGRAVLAALRGESDLWSQPLLEEALRDRPGQSYRLGWDRRIGGGSAAGRRMGSRTFGHLGFTGTSLWCDPDASLVVVLLSNRVYPSRANRKIRGFRPAFHDGVVASFGQGPP